MFRIYIWRVWAHQFSTVATGLVQTSLMLSLLKYVQKAAIIESSNVEQSPEKVKKILSWPS